MPSEEECLGKPKVKRGDRKDGGKLQHGRYYLTTSMILFNVNGRNTAITRQIVTRGNKTRLN